MVTQSDILSPLWLSCLSKSLNNSTDLKTLTRRGWIHFIRHAFAEQRPSNLSWYNNMSTLLEIAGHASQQHGLANPVQIKLKLQEYFDQIWDGQRKMSQKLSCYNQVKKDTSNSISFEPFLLLKDSKSRKCLMQLRSSIHCLNCETARYTGAKNFDKYQCSGSWFKRC